MKSDKRIILTLCVLEDAKEMILDGFVPVMYTGTHLIMKKMGTDKLINGLSEIVWEKKRRKLVTKNRFRVYDGYRKRI